MPLSTHTLTITTSIIPGGCIVIRLLQFVINVVNSVSKTKGRFIPNQTQPTASTEELARRFHDY